MLNCNLSLWKHPSLVPREGASITNREWLYHAVLHIHHWYSRKNDSTAFVSAHEDWMKAWPLDPVDLVTR